MNTTKIMGSIAMATLAFFTSCSSGSSGTGSIEIRRTTSTIGDGSTDTVGSVSSILPAPTLRYRIENMGTAALHLAGDIRIGTSPAPLNITGPITIKQPSSSTLSANGGVVEFDVDYQVSSTGAFSFCLILDTDAGIGQEGQTFEINVIGTGDSRTRTPVTTLAGKQLSDGSSHDIGTIFTEALTTLEFKVANTGTGPLVFTGASPHVLVDNVENFETTATVIAPSGTVGAGSETTFEIEFRPSTTGPVSFDVIFATNGTTGQTGPTFDIHITGTAKAPDRQIIVRRAFTHVSESSSLDLGRRGYGSLGAEVLFTIENRGVDALHLKGLSPVSIPLAPASLNLSGPVLITPPATNTIPGGGTVDFKLEFTVAGTGPFDFPVQIETDASANQTGATFDFNVTGKGATEVVYYKENQTGITEVYANGTSAGNIETRLITAGLNTGSILAPYGKTSPDGQFVAYTYQGAGTEANRLLYVVSTAGGTPILITPDPGVRSPSSPRRLLSFEWGADSFGKQLLAVRTDHFAASAGIAELFTCIVTGPAPTLSFYLKVTGWGTVNANRMVEGMRWSPDGTRLAFSTLGNPGAGFARSEVWGLIYFQGFYGAPANMVGTQAIANPSYEVRHFEWADQNTFVYSADIDQAVDYRVYAIPTTVTGSAITAGARVNLTANLGLSASVMPAPEGWQLSPDKTRLAYIGQTLGSDGRVYLSTVETMLAPTPLLAHPSKAIPVGGEASKVMWAHAGQSITFAADFDVDEQQDLYLQQLTTAGGAITLTGDTINLSKTKTNEDISLAQVSPEGGRATWVLSALDTASMLTTRTIQVVGLSATPTPTTITAALAPPGNGIAELQWRPGDGSFVLFLAQSPGSVDYQAYAVPLTGDTLTSPAPGFLVSGPVYAGGVSEISFLR